MKPIFSVEKAKGLLEKGYTSSKQLLADKQGLDNFLEKLETKIAKVPMVGSKLAMIPTLASLLSHFAQGKYKTIPFKSILAITSALIYFVTPIDAILDILPGAGFIDDAAVLSFCLSLVASDVTAYKEWRANRVEIIEGIEN